VTPNSDYELTTSATARKLNRSEGTVREYDRTGRLKAIRSSAGHRLFSTTEVDTLRAQLTADGGRSDE
jgi:DNA-binding transcriptional MerR regulator